MLSILLGPHCRHSSNPVILNHIMNRNPLPRPRTFRGPGVEGDHGFYQQSSRHIFSLNYNMESFLQKIPLSCPPCHLCNPKVVLKAPNSHGLEDIIDPHQRIVTPRLLLSLC